MTRGIIEPLPVAFGEAVKRVVKPNTLPKIEKQATKKQQASSKKRRQA